MESRHTRCTQKDRYRSRATQTASSHPRHHGSTNLLLDVGASPGPGVCPEATSFTTHTACLPKAPSCFPAFQGRPGLHTFLHSMTLYVYCTVFVVSFHCKNLTHVIMFKCVLPMLGNGRHLQRLTKKGLVNGCGEPAGTAGGTRDQEEAGPGVAQC